MAIEKDLLDQLLAGRHPKDVFNKDGLVDELKKALSERILNAEIDEHLDGDGGEAKGNHRNGYSKKSVLTGTSKMTLSVPRDRAGTFDPKLIAKYQRRFPDFDEKIIVSDKPLHSGLGPWPALYRRKRDFEAASAFVLFKRSVALLRRCIRSPISSSGPLRVFQRRHCS